MSDDMFRKTFGLEFICSECGEHLRFSSVNEDLKDRKVNGFCKSAFDTYLVKKVHPCEGCISKARELLNHLKKALSLLEEGLKSE